MSDTELDTIETLPQPTIGTRGELWFAGGRPRFKAWTGRTEMELSKLLHKSAGKLEGGRIARKISLILAHMAIEIAGATFHSDDGRELMSLQEREMFLRNMWETDVLTAFFMYRNDSKGDSMCKLPLLSPYDPMGTRTVEWVADLNDLPFEGEPSIEASRVRHDFKKPITLRGKQVDHVILGPHKWHVAEDMRFQSKPYEAELRLLAGSIHFVPGLPADTALTMEDLFDVPGVELTAMAKSLKHSGLDLSIEAYDKVADKEFQTTVPWLHPDFLG